MIRIIIFALICILYSSCSSTTKYVRDDTEIEDVSVTDAVLVTKFDSNISALGEFLYFRAAYYLKSKDNTEEIYFLDSAIEREDKLNVISVPPGEYYWEYATTPNLFILFSKRAKFENAPTIIAKKGVITYIGNINVEYNKTNMIKPIEMIKIIDSEKEILDFLNERHSKLMSILPYEKAISAITLKK